MKLTLAEHDRGKRLDQVLAKQLSVSRSKLQAAIKNGDILMAGQRVSPRYLIKGAEILTIHLKQDVLTDDAPEAIPLVPVYEDETILVINKPAGLTVHPGAGQASGTLLNALLFHVALLKHLPRAGIVHRLDKNTTGLMVIAKTESALQVLTQQLKKRTIKRQYLAIVEGAMTSGQTIDYRIGRDKAHRTRMKAFSEAFTAAKEAITHIRIKKKWRHHTLVEANLETGRTHQIRVHLAKINYPVVGDRVYGRLRLPKGASDVLREALQGFKRQALHAEKLSFCHPLTGEAMTFSVPPPEDMQHLCQVIQQEQDAL